ncbi:MAG: TatD family hydrolase [Desulfobacter sp.]|nr:TatD family hydrolase [Desulfobacter sp.]WDP84960.1 MAG: TatD family hydrolase [Desulfobacter sp.]
MILFDSHCHIDDKSYDPDLDQMMERAEKAGVRAMMVVGVDQATSLKAIEIAQAYDHVFTSVGVHPHDAIQCSGQVLDSLKELAQTRDCVKAWGETGLDFNRMFSPKPDQEACFCAQLAMAGSLDLPLIFHERDSKGRFYEILKSEGPAARRGVVHCFSGTKDEMFKYLDLGYYIGITGILTILNRGAYLRQIAPLIPEDRILIETDAPYLTPKPQKNKFRRNEPAFVASVLERLAQIKNTDPEALAEKIFKNTQDLYQVKI